MTFRRAMATGFVLIATMAVGITTLSVSHASDTEVKLRGTGASFPYPIYARWFREFSDRTDNVFISYEMTSSGAGIRDFIGQTVDFAGSDAAMDAAEIARVEPGAVILPVTAGEVVLIFNLPDVKTLKLSREIYTGIFLGRITRWNDARITAANPGIDLPDLAITVATRSDPSGTSYIFTGHLSSISQDFSQIVGHSRKPNWPAADGFMRRPGNQGVAAIVNQTPGAIGYVEYDFAKLVELPVAQLENRAGNFVAPTPEAGAAALADVQFPEGRLPGSGAPNLIAWVWDPHDERAYPITSFTWLLLYADQDDHKAKALRQLLVYILSDAAQAQAADTGYIPLPEDVRVKARNATAFIR